MRAPKRRRPQKRTFSRPPAEVDLHAIADRAKYVDSPEHKKNPSFAGSPRPRADATLCDPALDDQRQLTLWVRDAIKARRCNWQPGLATPFPKYIWHKEGTTVYEGRLVNQDKGEYKGYELNRDEWPAELS